MKGARYKMFLICLGTNKKLFILEIMKLQVKGGIKILQKLNKIIFVSTTVFAKLC